jgi:hypothetical protein
MKAFFEHKCHKCGLIDEARFVHAGPHLKQICNGCGFYVKFIDKSEIPDHIEIKQKIWFIANQNLALIKKAKQEVEFIELTGLSRKLQYWKLYLKVREYVQKGATV